MSVEVGAPNVTGEIACRPFASSPQPQPQLGALRHHESVCPAVACAVPCRVAAHGTGTFLGAARRCPRHRGLVPGVLELLGDRQHYWLLRGRSVTLKLSSCRQRLTVANGIASG